MCPTCWARSFVCQSQNWRCSSQTRWGHNSERRKASRFRIRIGGEGGALRRVQSAAGGHNGQSHRYNFIWLASALQNWSKRCKIRKLTRDKWVNGLFYLISDSKCVVIVFPFFFLKFIEADISAFDSESAERQVRGALKIAPVFVRDRAKSGAAGTRGAQRGA